MAVSERRCACTTAMKPETTRWNCPSSPVDGFSEAGRGPISLLWDGDDGAPGGGIHNGARRHLDAERLEMGGTVSKSAGPASNWAAPIIKSWSLICRRTR